MSNSISTLLTRNLQDVFGENDPALRRAATPTSGLRVIRPQSTTTKGCGLWLESHSRIPICPALS
jgi:hypothetical protein